MAVVGILALHLTGPGRQQVLQGAKTVLDPGAPLPGPDEPWPADGCVETHHVELLFPGLTDHDEGHGTIRRTPAISGDLLSAVISTRYILGFRKDNPNVFNDLIQNWLCF